MFCFHSIRNIRDKSEEKLGYQEISQNASVETVEHCLSISRAAKMKQR